ncbi:hypothetical protein ACFY9C_04680 [Streptomyces filamentosus]|uniref:hypothetical protein n=1 Tax=Streptomyces filamentosus TaxID=67294 RepID=UPI0036F0D1A0
MAHAEHTAHFTLDPDFTVGPRPFGSFVEHPGRCVCTGVYGPGRPAADPDPKACNALAEPGRVAPHEVPGAELVDGVLKAVPEPLSWNVVRLA